MWFNCPWQSSAPIIPCCVIAFATVVWCGVMNAQQNVQVLWQRARDTKQGHGSNSESLDSHKLGMCDGSRRAHPLCRQSTAGLEDPHRVDWMWLQTLRTVFTCRRLGGACWGDGTHRYFSSSATCPSLPGSRLEPGQFKDCEGQLFATFEAVRATVPPASFSLLGCTAPSGYVFHKVQFRVEEERSDTDQDLQD